MNRVILNSTDGSVWEFFRNENADLCYIVNGKESVLQGNIYEHFDIITDTNGDFHLVAQECTGSLIYLTYNHSNWRRFVVLNSKSPDSRMYGFRLFLINGRIHCFYILGIGKAPMLIHHTFSLCAQSETPNVISYTDSSKYFDCSADAKGNIHIFFFNEDSLMCYKIYHTQSAEYKDSRISVDDEIKSICPIYSEKSGINFLYTAKIKAYYALIFYNQQKKERKIITFSESSASDICMLIHDENIFIQWRERTRFYQCSSSDGGASFKKPSPVNESKNRHAVCVRVRLPSNPFNFNCNRCVALSNGKETELLNISHFINKINNPYAEKMHMKNHQSEKIDYNSIDGQTNDELKYIRSKMKENERELIRLNTIINTLSDKVSCLTKVRFSDNATAISQTSVSTDNTHFKNDVGDIGEDNYRVFKSTDADSIDFENSKKF